MPQTELLHRAQEYANRNELTIKERLGFGVHGIVLAVENEAKGYRSAIKVHERETEYRKERDLRSAGIERYNGDSRLRGS